MLKLLAYLALAGCMSAALAETSFNCHNATCIACTQFNISSAKENLCLDLTYQPDTQMLDIEVDLNDKIVFNKEVSTKVNPGLCTPIPFIIRLIWTCLKFEHFVNNPVNGTLSACVDLTGRGFFWPNKIFDFTLGCFTIPY